MPADAQVQRVIFASTGFDQTNRFWVISRPNHLQNEPYVETLLDLDPKTGACIPHLAEKWEASPDMKEWTLFLRKGVPFHCLVMIWIDVSRCCPGPRPTI
jgi:ABC-type transport system substrate-binding protein